jgi:hypothetical protein
MPADPKVTPRIKVRAFTVENSVNKFQQALDEASKIDLRFGNLNEHEGTVD